MPSSRNDKKALLEKVLALEEDDLLDPELPEEVLDEALRRDGIDPDALAERSRAFVEQLKQRFPSSEATQLKELPSRTRPAWQRAASSRRRELEARAATVDGMLDDELASLSRAQLLAEVSALRSDPHLRAAFRKRKPEASDDEELRLMIRMARKLRALANPDEEGEK